MKAKNSIGVSDDAARGRAGGGVNDKKYWRSLERLHGSPAFASSTSRGGEFPEGASDAPEGVSRRAMLGIMGASFAMVGLEGCRRPVETIVPYVQAPENVIPGIPRYYASTFALGSSAYGVVVESHEGRPGKIEGNALHPGSLGAANAWAQASVLNLYDPDRSGSLRQGRPKEGHAAAGEAAGHAAQKHHAAGEAEDAAPTWDDFATYWQGRAEELAADEGAGLALLSAAHASPTLARQAAALKARYPASRWVVYEPVGDENSLCGTAMAAGAELRPVHHLDRATVVLALDADFLGCGGDNVRASKDFAAARRVKKPGDPMSRLYVAESHLSLTGANADHRWRLKRGEIPAFVLAVAAAVGIPGAVAPSLPVAAAAKATVIAEDLLAAGSGALVMAGQAQAPEVHALVLAINQALGALGTTLTLHSSEDVGYSDRQALARLASSMQAGEISDLVILGGNPAYDAPAELAFAAALGAVEHAVHLSQYEDETSHLCTWHLPASHYLESWEDSRSADGTVSLVQPLIAPLLGGKNAIELVALLAQGEVASAYDLVRQARQGAAAALDEGTWRKALHDGVWEGSALPAAEPGAIDGGAWAARVAGLVASPELELTFHLSPSVHDGRFVNNGWLQELPDPITKITWDNALYISPATAAELALTSGDRLRVSHAGASLEAPVFVLPGQADGSLAIELGYGRERAGRVGNGVGVNAYPLFRSADAAGEGGVTVEKIDGFYALTQTQEHWDMLDRPIVRESTVQEYPKHPEFAEGPEFPHDVQMFPDHSYAEGPQWGLAIDLNACTGCNACMVACQSENNIPIVGREQVGRGREMHWIRIDRYFVGDEGDPETVFQPVPCMHCENAPCEQVCPVAATVHDRNGINSMIYNRCIGTRYCSNNCPYKVRRFNFFNYTKDTPELMKLAMNPDVTVRSRGVMEKCTYCVQRINEAQIVAKRAGTTVRDGDVRSACQQTCPTDAITFGDISDPASAVAEAKGQARNYTMLEELNNRPRTSYLGKLRNPNPAWAGA